MKNHFEDLQQLFRLDCLLLFIVGYVCPMSDLSEFCDNIRIPYAIALVCTRLEKYDTLSKLKPIEVNKKLTFISLLVAHFITDH